MILCVNLNPCVDKTLYLERIKPNVIQSASAVTVTVGGKANNVARVLEGLRARRRGDELLRPRDGAALR